MSEAVNLIDNQTETIIFICDEDFHRGHDAYQYAESAEEGDLDQIGLLVKNRKWKKLKLSNLQFVTNEYDARYDVVEKTLRASENALVTVLINSQGGRGDFSETIVRVLKFGKENFRWRTQAIIGNEAASAAAMVAITADAIIGTDNAELMFHHTTVNNEVVFFSHERFYDSLEAQLKRLESLSDNKVAYQQSAVRLKIKDASEKRILSNPEINLTGKDLREARIIKSSSPITPEEISRAIRAVTDECSIFRRRLLSFSRKIK